MCYTDYGVVSVHHVGLLCENLEKSLHFYQNILGMLKKFPIAHAYIFFCWGFVLEDYQNILGILKKFPISHAYIYIYIYILSVLFVLEEKVKLLTVVLLCQN